MLCFVAEFVDGTMMMTSESHDMDEDDISSADDFGEQSTDSKQAGSTCTCIDRLTDM